MMVVSVGVSKVVVVVVMSEWWLVDVGASHYDIRRLFASFNSLFASWSKKSSRAKDKLNQMYVTEHNSIQRQHD